MVGRQRGAPGYAVSAAARRAASWSGRTYPCPRVPDRRVAACALDLSRLTAALNCESAPTGAAEAWLALVKDVQAIVQTPSNDQGWTTARLPVSRSHIIVQ